jgi:hypothetical protein
MHIRNGLKTFTKLIEPSWIELLTIFTLFVILFIANQFQQTSSNNFTNLGAVTFKGTFISGISHWIGTLYTSKEFSTIAVYIFWLLVATLVYFVAFRLTKNAEEAVEDVSIRHYLWPRGANRNKPIEEYFEKIAIKIIVLVIICLYVIKLSPMLVNWWKHHYIYSISTLHGFAIYLILLLFVGLYMHGLVVLVRALTLRLRIINLVG